MSTLQRREVFSSLASGFRKKEEVVLRPPYFSDYSLFDKECLTCKEKACATFCEEEIICIGENGSPYLDFAQGGCTYCDGCAKACDGDVLSLVDKTQINTNVSIATKECLAWNNTMCSSCLDACDENAIKFFGVFRPIIDMELCTKCGFCYGICPTRAVVFKAKGV